MSARHSKRGDALLATSRCAVTRWPGGWPAGQPAHGDDMRQHQIVGLCQTPSVPLESPRASLAPGHLKKHCQGLLPTLSTRTGLTSSACQPQRYALFAQAKRTRSGFLAMHDEDAATNCPIQDQKVLITHGTVALSLSLSLSLSVSLWVPSSNGSTTGLNIRLAGRQAMLTCLRSAGESSASKAKSGKRRCQEHC